MNDDFIKAILELARDNPDMQETLIKSAGIAKRGYSIPTVQYVEALDETMDIHFGHLNYDLSEEERDNFLEALKKVDSMTVGHLATLCNYARTALLIKEAEGHELTEPEKTIKDIDIPLLAFFVIHHTPKVIGRRKPIKEKPTGYATPEEYEKAKAEFLKQDNTN